MELKEYLVAQVEFKKDSSNVHYINEALTNYRIAIELANGEHWILSNKTEEQKKHIMKKALITAECWEHYLEVFITSGIFKKDIRPRPYI